MTWVDWAIVFVLAASVIGGLTTGFFRSVFSLCGLIFGLATAAWNYGRAATIIFPLVHVESIANAIGFILIALLIMGIASLAGAFFAKMMRSVGLGCLDRLAGGVFGLLQGGLLITLGVLVVLAFFPRAEWLSEARLPKYFFGICHVSMQVSPTELSDRVREGLKLMEERAPEWMHPPAG